MVFVWNPVHRTLILYVDGVEMGSGNANIQGTEGASLSKFAGDWTFGKAEGTATLGADVKNFYLYKSANIPGLFVSVFCCSHYPCQAVKP